VLAAEAPANTPVREPAMKGKSRVSLLFAAVGVLLVLRPADAAEPQRVHAQTLVYQKGTVWDSLLPQLQDNEQVWVEGVVKEVRADGSVVIWAEDKAESWRINLGGNVPPKNTIVEFKVICQFERESPAFATLKTLQKGDKVTIHGRYAGADFNGKDP